MDTKYFIGEIDLPNGKIRKELIKGYRINDDVHDAIERKVKNLQLDIDNFKTNIDKSFWLPFRPIGSFLVRGATTQEILEDSLKDFYKIVSINVIRIRKENKLSQLKLANAIGHNNATFIAEKTTNRKF